MALHAEKIESARAMTIFKAPYVASAIYGFIFHPMEHIGNGTMFVTDRLVLGYDMKWAEEATIDELAADLFHEVNHFLRKHFERAPKVVHADLWSLAGDLAINPDLRTGGWKLRDYGPMGAIFPADIGFPEGKTTEEYYDMLVQARAQRQSKQQQSQKGGQPQKSKGKAQGQGSGDGQGQSDSQKNDPQSQNHQNKPGQGQKQDPNAQAKGGGQQPDQGQGQNQQQQQQGGSGADKNWQKPSPQELLNQFLDGDRPFQVVAGGSCGGISGHSGHESLEEELNKSDLGRNDAEIKGIEKRVAADIKAYAESKGRGALPGSMLDFIKVLDEESYVRWEEELAQVLRDSSGRIQAGGSDFSFSRPSKRSYMSGFARPGMVEHLPEVGMVMDTSGSMGKKQLVRAAREGYAIMQALGIDEIWFAEADAGVAMEWRRVGPDFFQALEIAGRGGTDFRPALKSAEKLNPRPDLLMYLTDGDGTAPKEPPPGMEVVWCIVPSYYNRAPAKWGHTVFITDDPKVRNRPTVHTDDDDEDDTGT